MIKRTLYQLYKMIRNAFNEYKLKRSWKRWVNYEAKYSTNTDVQLNEYQKEQVQKFWSRYNFAYPNINYNSFKIYMNRSGVFSEKYIPGGIRGKFIAPYLNNKQYQRCWNNKALLPKNLKGIKQPRMIVCKMNGLYYDVNYRKITLDEAITLVEQEFILEKELVFKISESQGGMAVRFFGDERKLSREDIFEELVKTKSTLVIQEAIKQHPQMALLNPSTVNTVRITSIIWKGDVKITGRVVKAGAPGKKVDNFHFGGHLIGFDKDGILNRFALNINNKKVEILPSGFKLNGISTFRIPNYESVCDFVRDAHIQLPYTKLISWDIAIGEDGDPILIELNFGGDIKLHQVSTGPVFEEYTEELLDECILKNYFKKHSSFRFDFKEFYDHIEIEKYVGTSKKVIIPETLKNKPVTAICERAFYGNINIEQVVLPEKLMVINANAFSYCRNLYKINLRDDMTIGKNSFNGTKLQ